MVSAVVDAAVNVADGIIDGEVHSIVAMASSHSKTSMVSIVGLTACIASRCVLRIDDAYSLLASLLVATDHACGMHEYSKMVDTVVDSTSGVDDAPSRKSCVVLASISHDR